MTALQPREREQHIVNEYKARRARFGKRLINPLFGALGLLLVATFLIPWLRMYWVTSAAAAAIIGCQALLSYYRFQPYCPACEMGRAVRTRGGLTCNHCHALLT